MAFVVVADAVSPGDRVVEDEVAVQGGDEEAPVVGLQHLGAGLEVVVARPALLAEGEVVAELPALLDGLLRRVDARAGDEVGRADPRDVGVVGRDVVLEVLEHHGQLVDLARPEHGGVLGDRGVDLVGVGRRSRREQVPAGEVVLAVVVLESVADDHRVLGAQLEVQLGGEQVVPERLLDRAFLVRQDAVREDGVGLVAPVPLVGHEEVGLVLLDRPAQGAAELLLAEVRLRRVRLLLEVGPGVQALVAGEEERAAVELVRPALGDHVDDAAHRAAVLRAVALGGDLVLLDGVVAELLEEPANDPVVVVAAVHVDDHRAAGGATVADPAHLGLGGVVVVRGTRAGDEQREVLELPPVEGDVLDHLLRDHLADVGSGRLNQRRLAHDLDGLGDRSHLHGEVDGHGVADPDLHSLRDLRREAGQRRGHVVGAGREGGNAVGAGRADDRGAGEAGGGALGGHRRPGHGTSALVKHAAVDHADVALCPYGCGKSYSQTDCDREDGGEGRPSQQRHAYLQKGPRRHRKLHVSM